MNAESYLFRGPPLSFTVESKGMPLTQWTILVRQLGPTDHGTGTTEIKETNCHVKKEIYEEKSYLDRRDFLMLLSCG